jgi:NADPH-dependent 2,4-dienoyl-CoA reductase/sulfur reductase-like enzyme
MYLRSLADSRAIIARATGGAKRAVVVGASFIGLEVAASLRARGLEVEVVAPEQLPLARILGDELGTFIKKLHEEHGVRFHLGTKPKKIQPGKVTLDTGDVLACDLVVAGVGVRPRVELAQKAGLAVDRGIIVDERLQTSASGIYAIGDLARFPEVVSGHSARIEHWVVAERHAQAVARTIVGRGGPFRDVPFFWSQHYDVPIAYVGHAETWDRIRVKGTIDGRDCLVGYEKQGKLQAVASIYRDGDSLAAEAAFERGDYGAVARLFE